MKATGIKLKSALELLFGPVIVEFYEPMNVRGADAGTIRWALRSKFHSDIPVWLKHTMFKYGDYNLLELGVSGITTVREGENDVNVVYVPLPDLRKKDK